MFREYLNFYVSILMICSPFSAITVLLSLTRDLSLKERKKISLRSSFVVVFILVGVTWTGATVLNFLQISVPAFQIVGGSVLFSLALSMLKGEVSPMKKTPEEARSIAVVPLGIPLIAGPGAISSVIVQAGVHDSPLHHFYMTLSVVAVALTLGICLYYASFLERKIGKAGMSIFNRLGGLIVGAIAVDIFCSGVATLFPALR